MSESPAQVPPHPATTSGQLVARASKTFCFKNFMIVAMCLGAAIWFGYDGWVGYPSKNNWLVANKIAPLLDKHELGEEYRDAIEHWKGWNSEDASSQARMTDITLAIKTINIEGWHSTTDIQTQRYIVYGLIVATCFALWRFIHYLRQRAIADATWVSPAPGITIPWDKITVVDNTHWKKIGIVDITYDLGDGPKKAKFDDYELEREPLLLVLDQLSEKALKAEFIPKEDLVENNPTNPTQPPAAA